MKKRQTVLGLQFYSQGISTVGLALLNSSASHRLEAEDQRCTERESCIDSYVVVISFSVVFRVNQGGKCCYRAPRTQMSMAGLIMMHEESLLRISRTVQRSNGNAELFDGAIGCRYQSAGGRNARKAREYSW